MTDTTVPASAFGRTRKDIRRLIAGTYLHDLIVLTATATGSPSTFRDDIELTDSQGAYVGSQGLMTGGTVANLGEVVRVRGSDQATHTLTFEPALPQAVASGDEMELMRLNGRGWRVQEYHQAINDTLRDDFSETLIDRVDVISPVFNAASPTFAIPAGISHISALYFQDNYDDWYVIPRAARGGAYGQGFWIDRASLTIGIEGRFRDDADGLTLRVHGLGRHPLLTADSDVCLVDPEWLARAVAARLALNSPDRSMRELGALLRQEADVREQNSRRPRSANTRRVR